MMPTLLLHRWGSLLATEAPVGITLWEAARVAGVAIADDCGRLGACTACGISILEGKKAVSPMGEAEREILEALLGGAPPGSFRLSCQARMMGEVEIEVPD